MKSCYFVFNEQVHKCRDLCTYDTKFAHHDFTYAFSILQFALIFEELALFVYLLQHLIYAF